MSRLTMHERVAAYDAGKRLVGTVVGIDYEQRLVSVLPENQNMPNYITLRMEQVRRLIRKRRTIWCVEFGDGLKSFSFKEPDLSDFSEFGGVKISKYLETTDEQVLWVLLRKGDNSPVAVYADPEQADVAAEEFDRKVVEFVEVRKKK